MIPLQTRNDQIHHQDNKVQEISDKNIDLSIYNPDHLENIKLTGTQTIRITEI